MLGNHLKMTFNLSDQIIIEAMDAEGGVIERDSLLKDGSLRMGSLKGDC